MQSSIESLSRGWLTCLLGAMTMALSACLPPSAARSRTASLAQIAAADSQAKAAVAFESSIDPQGLDAAVVGVAPFAVAEADSVLVALGYGLSDLMLGDLSVVKQLTVVDRLRTDAMLRELAYVQNAFVDTTRAPQVGRLLRAGRLVTGVLSPAQKKGQFAVAIRVVDSRTGRIGDSLTAAAGLKQMLDAEKALVLRTLELLGVQPTPAEREQIGQYQTRDLSALIAYGVGIEAGTRGDYATASEAFREALRADPGFVAARARLASLPTSPGTDDLRQQVLALAGERVNTAAPTRVAEAADVGLISVRDVVRLIITVRLP